MAIAQKTWDNIKLEYELGKVEQDKAFTLLSEQFKVNRSTISKKAKSEGWIHGKFTPIIEREAQAIGMLEKNKAEKSHLNHTEALAVDLEIEERKRYIKFFEISAMKNQKLSNSKLSEDSTIPELNQHSQITLRNKETVLGKATVTTQVNVQQNNTTTIMTQEEKREKFKKRKLEILGS